MWPLTRVNRRIFGHSSSAATEVYAHLRHHPGKWAADREVGVISAALDGKASANVMPLTAK
jgi:hypothetical protein